MWLIVQFGEFIGAEAGIVEGGIAQVNEDMGNPLVIPAQFELRFLFYLVFIRPSFASFVSTANTLITPAKGKASGL
jgi:hypothetical protein